MIIKYKSRRHNTKRNPYHYKNHTLKLNKTKRHMRSNKKMSHDDNHYLHDEEHDNREKSTFNKKYQHVDKVNLILSNLESKRRNRTSKRGHYKINYRNYRQGFN